MRFGIVTNLAGKGLQIDAELVQSFLVSEGHSVALIQFDQPYPTERYDVLICMEVIAQEMFALAPRVWLFPNVEWLRPEYFRLVRNVEYIFAKTWNALYELQQRFSNVVYTGFLTQDRRDLSVPRERKFLHLGGESGFRNTDAVLAAWREYRWWNGIEADDAPLTLVSNSTMFTPEPTPGVTFIKRATNEEIAHMQNSHLFHLLPSAYEGYGHALHESQGVGAVMLTTAAGPMGELGAPFTVPSVREKKNNLAVLHEVSGADIRAAIPQMLAQPSHVIVRMQTEARARFERGNEEFRRKFRPFIVDRGGAEVTGKAKLAILGNFDPPYSTENDLLWTLRDMGHPVVAFQEDTVRTEEVVEGCKDVALLIYVHTHSWSTPGNFTLDEMIVRLRARGVKTCSFHLDRYFGLNAGDQRENRVGAHAFWHTDVVFTADGGNDERFKQRGVNHRWLAPGVVKRDCKMGNYVDDLASEVGFVGAEGYHTEYTFRGELLRFLREVYGTRFRLYQGFRGDRLNDVYASCAVVVGDSCFGGANRYWSDRVPETLGRGGFLIHPATRGLTIPGLVTFEPGNLEELEDKIDWYLNNPDAREYMRKVAHAWVCEHETYTNRMNTLLKVVGVS